MILMYLDLRLNFITIEILTPSFMQKLTILEGLVLTCCASKRQQCRAPQCQRLTKGQAHMGT